MSVRNIRIEDYSYNLPEEKIALHPLEKRDDAKLLIYKNDQISEDSFANLASHLPSNSLIVFNDTKVINARFIFHKTTGAKIEIFCIEPFGVFSNYETIMNMKASSQWKCFVGGASKWKDEILEKKINKNGFEFILKAEKVKNLGEAYLIKFSWEPHDTYFSEIISAIGLVPLPPYIKRSVENEDSNRYQTIFANVDGSVAAPTAGLHFTENVLKTISSKKIDSAFVTLHVGASTFKPVKSATMQGHEMHSEYININLETIDKLIRSDKIIAVGTTSLRTIETAYWMGVKILLNPAIEDLTLTQWEIYDSEFENSGISTKTAFEALQKWMIKKDQQNLFAKTQLLIAPSYKFRVAKYLITNFHQPNSTLLLLVAAAVGHNWKNIYDYAIENNFRFLSYGDTNLICIE